MRIAGIIVGLGVIITALASIPCQTHVTSQSVNAIPGTPAAVTDHASKALDSAIRKIDFRNFTYPWTKDQLGPGTFTLRDGSFNKKFEGEHIKVTFQTIEYGDVTGDGKDEAMISVYPYTGGNCQCYMVYVYGLVKQKPRLLWSFDTWDKAEGGFHKAYSDRGELVIELFGDDHFVDGEWRFGSAEGKFNGLCCPTTISRLRFRWDGNQFAFTGDRELFDYDWRKHQGER